MMFGVQDVLTIQESYTIWQKTRFVYPSIGASKVGSSHFEHHQYCIAHV